MKRKSRWNRFVYRHPLIWRWRFVVHHELCKVLGHRWEDPDGQPYFRTCTRCCWSPTEAPYTASPVAGFGRGWLSMLPFVRNK